MLNYLPSIFCFLFTISLYGQSTTEKINAFDQYVQEAKEKWKIPGLAISIIKDGDLIFSKGYGEPKIGSKTVVDEYTLFGIASTTKAMTAVGMGILVDRGLVKWEDRVIDHLPEFQLQDPYATKEIRIKDLFTHNTGLGNADFLWAYNDFAEKEIAMNMRHAPMSYPLRGGYTYQNIMYLFAGMVIEKISGRNWSRFMKEELWVPIGMENTFPYLKEATKNKNISFPHHYVNGKIEPIGEMNADAIGPAGSVWSCVNDMAKWVSFMLDSTKINGERLLKAETYAELLKPQVIIPPDQFYPTIQLTQPTWTTYGLGWFQHDYYGQTVHFHTGSLAGRVAIIGLLPSENLGFYFLGNLDHAELRHALMYKAFDTFGSLSSNRDWSEEMYNFYDKINQEEDAKKKRFFLKREKGTQPSKPIPAYLGTYNDPFYGEATVVLLDNKLILKLSAQLIFELEHWHYDTFLATNPKQPWSFPGLVQFKLNQDGGINGLEYGLRSFKKL